MFNCSFRENFLQLDIFYKQMSYEEITQQKAYDPFALICKYYIHKKKHTIHL